MSVSRNLEMLDGQSDLGERKKSLGQGDRVLEFTDRVDSALDGFGVLFASGSEDVPDFLMAFHEGLGSTRLERRKAHFDLGVGPVPVRGADEGGQVSSEDDGSAEDDDLLVKDKKLLGDGKSCACDAEGDPSRLGDDAVSRKGVEKRGSLGLGILGG
jgi:hypothetical protein